MAVKRTFVANTLTVEKNGTFNLGFTQGFTSITVEWTTTGVTPEGTLMLLVNGDYGNYDNTIDLSSGQRGLVSNVKLAIVDLVVTGFPVGGSCKLYFR